MISAFRCTAMGFKYGIIFWSRITAAPSTSCCTTRSRGEAFNVGGDNDATGLEVARAILELLGKPDNLVQFVEDRPGHDQRYALDCTKIKAMGWKPKWDFGAALAETVDWYVSNEEWWRNIKSGMDYKAYYQKQYGARATLATGSDAEN